MVVIKRLTNHTYWSWLKVLFFIIISFLIYIVVWKKSISTWYNDFYTDKVFRDVVVVRPKELKIAIVATIDRLERLNEYALAYRTVSCYAGVHQYTFVLIDFSKNETLRSICPQNDFMFKRHCAVSNMLKYSDFNYILFLDGDMGVINPNHLIEDYITPYENAEIIFYERMFNLEIAAGSYIVKKTTFAIKFLEKWANTFYHLPDSFHGTDNGAIHHVFLDVVCKNCSFRSEVCANVWRKSKNFADLQLFSSCVRSVIGDRNLFLDGKIVLLTDHTGYWVRDGWLTRNLWSESDFILHGWQKKYYHGYDFAGWNSPLAFDEKDLALKSVLSIHCLRENASVNWPYKNTFMKTDDYINNEVANNLASARANYLNNLLKIGSF